MKHIRLSLLVVILVVSLLPVPSSAGAPPESDVAAPVPKRLRLPVVANRVLRAMAQLGQTNLEYGLELDWGGDVDTEVVLVGTPPKPARRTGNGAALPSPDGNTIPDHYMQFRLADGILFAGSPTGRVRIEVEYFDQGTDTFRIEYDGAAGGPFGNGLFLSTGTVTKTNTRRFLTVAFALCDAFFANRDNGADFRIDDNADGGETIRRVTVILQPAGPQIINVDACGANPWDTSVDSTAIQACIDAACSGDTITFTSGVGSAGYQGYLIDKTIFLVATSAKSNLTFTSTNPSNHALLKATSGLKGFVVRLFARSRIPNPGDIDNITVKSLDMDGNRAARVCFGADELQNGVGDNWGSWLPECTVPDDPWCRPGTLAMDGGAVFTNQDYAAHPGDWSTGHLVDDVRITNTECGSALALNGAASTVRNTTIQTAGDHVHAPGCAFTDNDEPKGAWCDGMTLEGPGHTITNNTIINPSDVGIVFFGGKNTVISRNTVQVTSGNYGCFAGIAIHPWTFGDVSGVQVISNTVTSSGSTTCGGIHAGINIGTHMWGAGCVAWGAPSAVGNPGSCSAEPAPPAGTLCTEGAPCQVWAHVAAGKTFTLRGNSVTGAHINYLIEGLDLVGTLVESNNTSSTPRQSDWEAAKNGCWEGSLVVTWGPLSKVAHHPSRSGWTDKRIHCER